MARSRPDLASFEVGAIYRHDDTDALVQFLGVAWGTEPEGEDIGVFRLVDTDDCLLATERGHARGETFTPVGQVMEDDVQLGG